MEANENGLQDLQQNDKAPQTGAQKGFFSWLRVHIFDWWMRLLILFLLVVIMLLMLELVDVVAIKLDHVGLVGLVLLLLLGVNGILSIVDLCKKRIKQGGIGLIGTLLLGYLTLVLISVAFFLPGMGSEEDHFADNLKLPEGIELTEPLKPEEYTAAHSVEKVPEDSFQYQVIAAANSEKGLKKDDDCRVPALEKISLMPDGRECLIRYLNASPEWDVYEDEDRCGLYAVRHFQLDGSIYKSRNHYYLENEHNWNWQYRLGIGLDGRSWYPIKMNKTKFSGSKGVYESVSAYSNGEVVLDIFEQNKTSCRPMTAMTLKLLEKEFHTLHLLISEDPKQWVKAVPADTNIRKDAQPDIILYNDFQGGIYNADIWCNPGEPGLLYLKAFEITQGTPLSEDRMPNAKAGYSGDPNEMFLREMGFTIYEGNWGQYYGARFEVWFKPDSGQPDRKLLEKNFKIEGWER
ncbi:MAG: hypothetical protein IKS81_02560 [Verrucomicrobia bacterium]|nr:hypothetical protein [Verrucomicrobiota bacterium]